MLGCIMEFDPPNQRAGTLRLEHFVERTFGVGIEIVTNQEYFFAVGVECPSFLYQGL